jgi:23S rRNA pseudouridine1911/1915/1917 synthase
MPAFTISAAESGRTLLDVLGVRLRLSRPQAVRLVRQRRVCLGGLPCLDPVRRVRRGQRLEVRDAASAQWPPAGAKPVLFYVDAHVVVVDKPAGLTTVRHKQEAAEFGARARKFLPPTLADLLPQLVAQGRSGKPGRLRAVHRLDKDTSGLVVFARTPEVERHLGRQFRAHTIQRTYLALVRGRAQAGRIESFLVDDRGDGRRGSTAAPGRGKWAVTHVRVVEDLGEFTLVECRLETGRTHQVRIHLGEAGTPLCGERVYDRPLHGKPLPDRSGAPRLALHAAGLGFKHPATGKRINCTSPLPKDLQSLLTQLRNKRTKNQPKEPRHEG